MGCRVRPGDSYVLLRGADGEGLTGRDIVGLFGLWLLGWTVSVLELFSCFIY